MTLDDQIHLTQWTNTLSNSSSAIFNYSSSLSRLVDFSVTQTLTKSSRLLSRLIHLPRISVDCVNSSSCARGSLASISSGTCAFGAPDTMNWSMMSTLPALTIQTCIPALAFLHWPTPGTPGLTVPHSPSHSHTQILAFPRSLSGLGLGLPHSYSRAPFRSALALELGCIGRECIVGRVRRGSKWGIIDRSGSFSRTVDAVDDQE
ncbi:hypothetical protein JB92DRAFT_2986399 [Gautieria morchelliformis]|nr:hypothetical protein JB92DRAFT_2986399 [Gautieria morchelliformis]